ncbi:MAG: HAD-IC family P-type ATPase [Parcubacteria group bacterium]
MAPIFPSHNWYAISREKVLKLVNSETAGLTRSEADFRLEKYGSNEVALDDKHHIFKIFLRQFQSPLIYILIVAGIISAVLGDSLNAGIIFGAVILNALIGFVQELKVSNILDRLSQMVSYHTTVRRDGKEHIIDAKDVAVGDILILRQGDKISADARLIKTVNFKTNEIAFSGESSPVEKDYSVVLDVETGVADRNNMAFTGTSVEDGIGEAVVVAIGGQTEFGKIAELVRDRSESTPLQRKLGRLARGMGIVFVLISLALFIVGVLRGIDALTMFLTAVAVAVAAVPESLPVALSSTLAVGSKRILKKGGLIRRMIGAEALGSTTVIAADKTATLTEGKMKLTSIITSGGKELECEQFLSIVEQGQSTPELLTIQLLSLVHNATVETSIEDASEWQPKGKPIDRAVLSAVRSVGITDNTFDGLVKRIGEVPFDSRKKYSAVLNHFASDSPVGEQKRVKAKITAFGAPEMLLARSAKTYNEEGEIVKLTEERFDELYIKINELASKGFKVLALAHRNVAAQTHELKEEMVRDLTFLSLIAFSDPIRSDVKDAIHVAQAAGVRVVMVTGDHALTAKYVAKNVGILGIDDKRIIEGRKLPSNLLGVVDKYDVFARVSPEDKLSIVEALKNNGESVAMIGDGINDTPALIRADLGVAVGSGTDVAREAADLVLLGDSFSIIVEAIRQGRIILDNIKKVLIFLLSDAFTEIILIAGSILLGMPLALLPAQILWVNIIEDGMPTIALAFEGEENHVMKRKPDRTKKIFTRNMKFTVATFTIVTDFVLLGFFWFLLRESDSLENLDYARTMIFTILGIQSLFYVFSIKHLKEPIWKTDLLSNRVLLGGVGLGLLLYAVAIYIPFFQSILQTVSLSLNDWIIVSILGILSIAVIEFAKWKFIKHDEISELQDK